MDNNVDLQSRILNAIEHHMVGQIGDFEIVSKGLNLIFRLSLDSCPIFIRLTPSHFKSESDLRNEIQCLQNLERAVLPVCGCPDLDIDLVFGPILIDLIIYHGLITRAVEGQIRDTTPTNSRIFARCLAKIHRAFGSKTTDFPRPLDVHNVDEFSQTGFADVAGQLLNMAHRFADDIPNECWMGICHGDAWIGNAVFRNEEAILIDFEHQHFGPTSYDVATYVWHCLEPENEVKRASLRAFIDKYKRHSGIPFSEAELKYQILKKELNNLAFLDKFHDFDQNVANDIITRATQTLDWVQQESI